jgi:hypothetical protein
MRMPMTTNLQFNFASSLITSCTLPERRTAEGAQY